MAVAAIGWEAVHDAEVAVGICQVIGQQHFKVGRPENAESPVHLIKNCILIIDGLPITRTE